MFVTPPPSSARVLSVVAVDANVDVVVLLFDFSFRRRPPTPPLRECECVEPPLFFLPPRFFFAAAPCLLVYSARLSVRTITPFTSVRAGATWFEADARVAVRKGIRARVKLFAVRVL
jgi:hypothetical protein